MTDIYQTITDKIVEAIEAGAGDWRMPWHSTDGVTGVNPVSVSTGKRYRGLNTLALWCAQQSKGYDSPTWGTFKAWKDRGASVRKGEKATQIVFWKTISGSETDPETGDTVKRDHLMARGYYVFNAAQVEGYKPETIAPTLPLNVRMTRAEDFLRAIPVIVEHGGNRAYCSRDTGRIRLPRFEQFDSAQDYYSTRAHETVHWSGHAGRLDRVFGKRFGDEAYAAEELVAELGAAFLCGHLELSNEPRRDHAAYLASWLRVLKADKRAIFTAASKAQQAADYLIELAARAPVAEPAVVREAPEPVIVAPAPVLAPVAAPATPATPFRQWSRDPNFAPCKRSLKTGRKLRWRQYFGYHPADGLNHPPMNADQLARQAKLYAAWKAERDAALAREAEMPLAAD